MKTKIQYTEPEKRLEGFILFSENFSGARKIHAGKDTYEGSRAEAQRLFEEDQSCRIIVVVQYLNEHEVIRFKGERIVDE